MHFRRGLTACKHLRLVLTFLMILGLLSAGPLLSKAPIAEAQGTQGMPLNPSSSIAASPYFAAKPTSATAPYFAATPYFATTPNFAAAPSITAAPSIAAAPQTAATSELAHVYDAIELKAAIDANNDIVLMSDITIPSTWIASTTVYSGVFDGNGFSLKGDGGDMREPVFRRTDNAVFKNVAFIDFKMTRDKNPTANTFGALVDHFGNSGQKSRMTNCYIQGVFNVTSSIAQVYEATGEIFTYVGAVAGRLDAQEIVGAKGLISSNIQFVDMSWNRSPSVGGLVGTVYTNHFENNELMKGSSITTNSRYVGGLVWGITFPAEGGDMINCKANYRFYNQMTGTTGQIMYGGLCRYINNSRLIDRCTVECEVVGAGANAMTLFGGIACVQDGTLAAQTLSNCSVIFTGDPIATSFGAGILNTNPNTDPIKSIRFDNCYAQINMTAGSGGAGIFLERNYTSNTSGYNITILNSKTKGSINASYNNACLAGIAIAGPSDLQSGVIENCVSEMTLNDTSFRNVRIGGIWVNPSSRNTVNVMTIKDCLFSGNTIISSIDSSANQIYNCDPGNCTGNNNKTTTPGYTDAAGPNGLSIVIPSTYTITVTAGKGGSVTGGGIYQANAAVSLLAAADAGYAFIGWYENNELVSSSPVYNLTAAADRTLEGRFTDIAALTEPQFYDRLGHRLAHLTADALNTTLAYVNKTEREVNLTMIVVLKSPAGRVLKQGVCIKAIAPSETASFQVALDMPENINEMYFIQGYMVNVFLWDTVTLAPVIPMYTFQ